MSGRIPESLRGNPNRLTPLMMMNSFSRLHDSSLNRTADSGYQSSFASLSSSSTPSSSILSDSSSRLYCSTPVTDEDSILPSTTQILDPALDTPVHPVLTSRTQFSEDRIPSQRTTSLPLDQDTEDSPSDVLNCLIRSRTTPPIHRIFKYLGDEDLMRLCQVSDTYCRAVCDDQASIKRLSRFLISTHQNGENRTTLSHNNAGGRPYGGILRPIENVLGASLPVGTVWTVPSPLEAVEMSCVPRQFRELVELTRSLSENNCVSTCHSCRRLVAVRLHHHRSVECPNCSQRSRRTNGRHVTKPKATLFASFR